MKADAIASLFTTPVAVATATPQMYAGGLFPSEEQAVVQAVESRRRDFTAGRNCARAALARLGGPRTAIGVGLRRAPTWPDGYVGSISHCPGFCCAVVGHEADALALGIDVESSEPLAADLAALVCTPDEVTRCAALARRSGLDWWKLTFSAKEAFFKCYFPVTATFLAFEDVELTFAETGSESGVFSARIVDPGKPMAGRHAEFEGRWAHDGIHVYTGVTLRARRAPRSADA